MIAFHMNKKVKAAITLCPANNAISSVASGGGGQDRWPPPPALRGLVKKIL